MIRAFVGVRISPEMLQKISELRSRLQGHVQGIRWVGEENLHFTLKFLGPAGEAKITPIGEALEHTVRGTSRFQIIGRGIGVFPEIKKARVLWVGLESKELNRLAMLVENALEPMGFGRERRAFKPHLTIGRWRNFEGKPELLRQQIERWKDYHFGESWVEEVVFFQSVLKADGAVYSPLKVIPLMDN